MPFVCNGLCGTSYTIDEEFALRVLLGAESFKDIHCIVPMIDGGRDNGFLKVENRPDKGGWTFIASVGIILTILVILGIAFSNPNG